MKVSSQPLRSDSSVDTASKVPGRRSAGVGHEDVRPAEGLVVLLEDSGRVIVAGEVPRAEEHLHPVGAAQLARKGGQGLLPPRHEEEVGAFPSQGLGHRAAHPRRSPADEGHLAFQSVIHGFLLQMPGAGRGGRRTAYHSGTGGQSRYIAFR